MPRGGPVPVSGHVTRSLAVRRGLSTSCYGLTHHPARSPTKRRRSCYPQGVVHSSRQHSNPRSRPGVLCCLKTSQARLHVVAADVVPVRSATGTPEHCSVVPLLALGTEPTVDGRAKGRLEQRLPTEQVLAPMVPPVHGVSIPQANGRGLLLNPLSHPSGARASGQEHLQEGVDPPLQRSDEAQHRLSRLTWHQSRVILAVAKMQPCIHRGWRTCGELHPCHSDITGVGYPSDEAQCRGGGD